MALAWMVERLLMISRSMRRSRVTLVSPPVAERSLSRGDRTQLMVSPIRRKPGNYGMRCSELAHAFT